jgi:transcription-repair coupling factor (superfamily II helicase)
VPKLRRLARRLGIEKVVLKGGLMYLYFVGAENKAYYQSPMFGRLLSYLQLNPRRVKIRENGEKRSFSIYRVGTVAEALTVLETVLSLPAS